MRFALAALLAVAIVLVTISIPFGADQDALSVYNDDWDGAAHLFSATPTGLHFNGEPVVVLHGGFQHLDPQQDAVMVLAPAGGFTGADATHFRAFLEGGGRALVADDVGSGRNLISSLDAGVTIPGIPVFSTVYSKRPSFPVATSTGAIEGLPNETILNIPSVVLGNATPVLVTHEFSWLDQNANGRPDLSEPRDAWPVAQVVTVGDGELLVLGDPSIFTHEMDEASGATARALLAWLTEGDRRLVVDESHRGGGDPFNVGGVLAGESSMTLKATLAAAGLTGVALTVVRPRLTRVEPRRARAHPPRTTAVENDVLNELEESP